MITKLDFAAIPSQDSERSRSFYADPLGLRPDQHGQYEFWAGQTWASGSRGDFGMEFAPQKNAHLALHVDDVAGARADLEAKGVSFPGETLDTGVRQMAFFTDPDGNDLMLHHRYAPYQTRRADRRRCDRSGDPLRDSPPRASKRSRRRCPPTHVRPLRARARQQSCCSKCPSWSGDEPARS
jgi:catechol 2,3-dioxygenase-like lactoylglutathione lyase family enzyme